MDNDGESLFPNIEQNEDDPNAHLGLSDVLEALDRVEQGVEQPPDAPEMERPASLGKQCAPYARIVEQPASKALRFRYVCEGRSAGSIPGANSKPERRTYPTIEICNYVGPVLVVVCCVTSEDPPRVHPHNLVGRGCSRGVCNTNFTVTPESRTISFSNLGVQCVKRKEVEKTLRDRQADHVDPCGEGFGHIANAQSINLNAVRLAFRVYLPNESGLYRRRLHPACISDIIYDKKAMSDLHIHRVSACTGSVKGGLQMFLLCEKVARDEVAVVLEERDARARVLWSGAAGIECVHKMYAIVCKLPPYKNVKATQDVETYMYLERRSDGARSNEIKFTYIPESDHTAYIHGKKRKFLDKEQIDAYDRERSTPFQQDPQVKLEPRDMSPSLYNMCSPQVVSPPYVQDHQQWIPGPSTTQYHQQEQNRTPSYTQLSFQQTLQAMASNMSPISPPLPHMQHNMQDANANMQQLATNMHAMQNKQAMSPNAAAMSPHAHPMSPHGHPMSPHAQTMSPHAQTMSPNMTDMSSNMVMPNLQGLTPHMSGMSNMRLGSPHGAQALLPNLAMGSNMQPAPQNIQLAQPGGPWLVDDMAEMEQFNMELPGYLSDSLNKLSTNDLLQ